MIARLQHLLRHRLPHEVRRRLPPSAQRLLLWSQWRFSGGAMPRRRMGWWEDLSPASRSREKVTFHPVHPARPCDYAAPVTLSEDASFLPSLQGRRWAAAGVFTLEGGQLLGRHAEPVTAGGTLLLDAIFFDRKLPVESLQSQAPGRWQELSGLTLNLTSAWGGVNFGHFLLDCLGRLALVEAAGLPLSGFQHIVVPDLRLRSLSRLFPLFGVPADRLVVASDQTGLRAARLVQPTHPCAGACRVYPPWLVAFLRRHGQPATTTGRRLYLHRESSRRPFSNQAEIERALAVHGFQAVDLAHEERAAGLMAEAEIVVAPHGAAMSDLVFCAPGARVVEIFPPDWPYPYFTSLAAAAGLQRYAVVATRDPAHPGAFLLPPEKLARVLTLALPGR